jgi:uncharacterized membrane protein YkvA (DUF1232 family)
MRILVKNRLLSASRLSPHFLEPIDEFPDFFAAHGIE